MRNISYMHRRNVTGRALNYWEFIPDSEVHASEKEFYGDAERSWLFWTGKYISPQ